MEVKECFRMCQNAKLSPEKWVENVHGLRLFCNLLHFLHRVLLDMLTNDCLNDYVESLLEFYLSSLSGSVSFPFTSWLLSSKLLLLSFVGVSLASI